MRAELVRVEHAEPYYFTQYYYKCIDCGAEFSRHQCNDRINPYCGKCQRKHDTEAQKQRNKKRKNEQIIKELEELECQIIEKRQLIKRDTVIFTDIVWAKINTYNDVLLLIKKRIAELKEESDVLSNS